MGSKVLLLTPPFTQLNTPYPATAYIKGFLNTLSIESYQVDIGIEVIHRLFNNASLERIFHEVSPKINDSISDNLFRIYHLRAEYCKTIESVMHFLGGNNSTLAYQIGERNFLPEAGRFESVEDLDISFGQMGIVDKAKHIATLYLEDLGDFITNFIDPHFGFNRYGESLARAASSLDPILEALNIEHSLINEITVDILRDYVSQFSPQLVCITIPFPGNLFGALLCAKFIKNYAPEIKIAIGGGYVNTELRSLADERLFQFVDYVSLDDGETPLKLILEHLNQQRESAQLKRCFVFENGVVQYCNGAIEKDVAQRDTGTPDYSDIQWNLYLSVLEVANPMHRLWSDGKWNKLTLAHGCYWGKCSFCDVSLDYISRYEPISASILCDRIEKIMSQTGHNGFHFVDEAAPPALMGELALEIIRRDLVVTWWTNIRFEKNFSEDLCKLLRASGCIAVTGGLEVASDRLLAMMKKGVTIAQVSQVAQSFTKAGIMVHTYLMYGFPTQTVQETIDSLEVVRQLFEAKVIQSGFWHRFAMTAHSPVGLDPEAYGVVATGPKFQGFAENDLFHEDKSGANHDQFSEGLRISLFNYMNEAGIDLPLQTWFDFPIPKTNHQRNMVRQFLNQNDEKIRSNARVYYLGQSPVLRQELENDLIALYFGDIKNELIIELDQVEANWIIKYFERLKPSNGGLTIQEFKKSYCDLDLSFDELLETELWDILKEMGLIII